uniref:Protein pelota homolog n=1 Tax=Spumella elongata TaxID=89044 RepID=A0A7S3HQQ8_9STRA|mmetsp:Transcript_64172/g.113361  ORF Transcript_64172/g.113361 Transcript_64172/m.113361 type:complete len:407 (+) Transcript_64172:48-1268(+)
MKILKQTINIKTCLGCVVVQAEEEDDMYHLYNLINVGDAVEATTVRNVVNESKSGARDKSRIMTKITIQVENIDFDSEQCTLRLKGMSIKENEHLKLGQYHTLTLELNRPCEITKEHWDSLHLEALADMAEPTKKADLAVLTMQEGLANLCLVKAALTKTCAKIERSLPKKRQQGNQAYDTALSKFFSDIYESVQKNINFEVIKVILVGSPGFLKDDFLQYLLDRAVRDECTSLLKNKSKFVKAHTSSGHKRAIEEMLSDPAVSAMVGEAKAADEVRALQTFYDTLAADPDRACYGLSQVTSADEQLAVADLLITDTLCRSSDFAQRSRYVQLIDSVRSNGGKVFQFSSLHCTGEQLNLYTGIAATLRFPLPDIAEEEEEEQVESEADTDEGGDFDVDYDDLQSNF